VYALCDLDPACIAAVRHYGWVLVPHGPQLGQRVPADAELQRATELDTAQNKLGAIRIA
jgi:hypothetical protein